MRTERSDFRQERSVAEILGRLETQLAGHAERERAHAAEEAHHRERRELHAARKQKLQEAVEVFRIASVQAAELVEDVPVIETVPAPPEDLGSASKPRLTRMVSKWIEAKGPAEAFGPKELCRELNQLYGKKLRRQLDQRQVSDVLRRFERLGRLHRLQSGRPYGQTLYCRRNPGTAAVSPACT